jgi:hypothetical protein
MSLILAVILPQAPALPSTMVPLAMQAVQIARVPELTKRGAGHYRDKDARVSLHGLGDVEPDPMARVV